MTNVSKVLRMLVVSICFTATSTICLAADAPPIKWEPINLQFLYLISAVVLLGSLLAILSVKKALPPDWSLADALSEEVAIKPAMKTTTTKGVADASDVIVEESQIDIAGKPVLLPEMRASSSRVIALMGMIVILFMYMGFGVLSLFSFGVSGQFPKAIGEAINFLLSGMVLFAPYAVNKTSALFQNLTGSK